MKLNSQKQWEHQKKTVVPILSPEPQLDHFVLLVIIVLVCCFLLLRANFFFFFFFFFFFMGFHIKSSLFLLFFFVFLFLLFLINFNLELMCNASLLDLHPDVCFLFLFLYFFSSSLIIPFSFLSF